MDNQAPNNLSSVTPKVIPNESEAALLRAKRDHTEPERPTENPLLEEEMVIEEVSIDGMCGVY